MRMSLGELHGAGDFGGYVEKALEMGISFHWGPAGEPGCGAYLPGTLRDG